MSRRREKRKTLHGIQERRIRAAKRRLDGRDCFDNASGASLELPEYTIVYEPIPDPLLRSLPESTRQRLELLCQQITNPNEAMIAELAQLVEAHPHIPKLYNYLGVAYEHAGRDEDVRRVLHLTYAKFPNYLFAFVGHLRECVMEGNMAAAREAVQGRHALHMFIPDRRTYHCSEIFAFNTAMALYLAALGEIPAAKALYDSVKRMAPDHPHIKHLASLLEPEGLRRLVRSMVSELVGQGAVNALRA